ncbi:TrmH family RNA methyltransferase [Croceiramulus getboli]|nr:RNA methyltransferase [Flavobacteriaceae bacterium YJPT1-3]
MVSKSQLKHISGLARKKNRQQSRQFIVEGIKSINEFIQSGFSMEQIFALERAREEINSDQITSVSESELKKMSQLTTPQKALAVVNIKAWSSSRQQGLKLALDEVRDPGNLGTIIRLCDWFGIDQLICAIGTVDCYNPKVVQATMGSLSRVQVHYVDLPIYLKAATKPIYGAFMEGASVYEENLQEDAILVLGNEANGISPAVAKVITKKLSIPAFGESHNTESLNVAAASAILLSEFKRRSFTGR